MMYATSSADMSSVKSRENDESSLIARFDERMLTQSSLSRSIFAPGLSSRLTMFLYKTGCRLRVICLVAGVDR